MPDLWRDLLACLDLGVLPVSDRATADAVFEARNQDLPYHRLFGGQLLAQFVRAARRTCPGKEVKSLHAQFPRAGRSGEPVRYEARCHRDGNSFATLTVHALQSSEVVATASVSMHAVEGGREHQTVAEIPAVPGPECRVDLDLLPWETRSSTDLDSPAAAPPRYDLWMRVPPVDVELAPALTAYATDLSLIGTALRPLEGVSQRDAGSAFASAVTSHTVWFHRPFTSDDWLLLRQHSPLVAHGRCFGRGDVLTRDGTLVASFAQESLLRFTG